MCWWDCIAFGSGSQYEAFARANDGRSLTVDDLPPLVRHTHLKVLDRHREKGSEIGPLISCRAIWDDILKIGRIEFQYDEPSRHAHRECAR